MFCRFVSFASTGNSCLNSFAITNINKMKKALLLTLATLFMMRLMAQPPGVYGGGPAMGGGNAHIFGKIADNNGKALAEASVLVMQTKFDTVTKKQKEVLLKGMTTKGNGEFNFEDLPVSGPIALSISAVGYKTISQTVTLAPPFFEKDLGTIKLEVEATELGNVTVTASTKTLKLDIDKRVFSVDKNIVSAGGTGTDVMKNVPGVNVDIDGNVTVRNSAPQLFIDGRPTTLTLEQIPSDAIESVELMTNPSAKYDASGGGAGILNIILKKNKKTGYNGNVRLGVDKRGAVNGGIDLSARQGKFNVTASGMVNQMKGRTTGITDRNNLTGTPLTSVYQNNKSQNNGAFVFGKVGVDYLMSNKTTISLSGVKVHGEFKPTDLLGITTDSLYNTGIMSSYSDRLSNSKRVFNGGGLIVGFKQLFKTTGEELTFDANYFTGKNENNGLYTTNYLNNDKVVTGTLNQKIYGYGNDKNLILQTDYIKPFATTFKFETGLRAAIRSRENNDQNFIYSEAAKDYQLVTNASTHYKNNDNVYAAYATISSSIKNFGYKVGVRAESSDYSGTLLNTGEKFSNKYPVSLFPSVFLSQKLKGDQELQVSVTRRVNRPNFFNLIPFTDYSDSLNITKGNPALKPEFTTSFELSYLKNFAGNNTFLASVYYKRTTDLITRYIDTVTNALSGKQDLINTFVNANSSYTTGLELTSVNNMTKWWDMTTNVNFYNSKINADNVTGSSQAALWSWFGKYNSNFKMTKGFTAQLSATYQSKTNLPVNNNGGGFGPPQQSQSAAQGYISPSWGIDLAFKKTFLKNNAAAVTLSINDIFRTRVSNQYSESAYFTQQYNRLRDPQMIRLNFSYRFGKLDATLFKRTSKGTGESAGTM
jgi:ferric enterobactin receptor